MKLTSSKDFGKTLKDKTDSEYRRLRDNFDNFLEQPLTLGKFVPCDEDGNVLEEPKDYDLGLKFPYSNKHSIECEKYQQAQERVLFEGFEVIYNSKYTTVIDNSDIEREISLRKDNTQSPRKIEWLILEKYDLTLTETALKQIGL